MDFYTHLTFKVQEGRGLGSRDPISEFWDHPYNFGTNRNICSRFGTDIDDVPLLRPRYNWTHKWAWPGSRDLIS